MGREYQEEVGSHGLPIQLPEVGNPGFQWLRSHQERHLVPNLKPHALGKLQLDRHQGLTGISGPPLTGHQGIFCRQGLGPGEIGFPLAPALFVIVGSGQVFVVYRHNTTANHRVQRLARDALFPQRLLHSLQIFRADIYHEVIGRILWQLRLPFVDQ